MAISGSCLCGNTRFEIDFVPEAAASCNCSFCTKRGALWAYGEPDQLRILTPIENTAEWSRTPENHHHFCPNCGCVTFSNTPDYSQMWQEGFKEEDFDVTKRRISVNLRVLDNFDVEALPVEHLDGRHEW